MTKRWLAHLALALLMAAGLGGGAEGASAAPAGLATLEPLRPAMDCAALAGADLSAAVGSKATVTSARLYPGAQPFCGVQGTIAPRIGFAVKLPTEGWTQRVVQLGCGGLCGVIALRPDHADGCVPITAGQAVLASTDMGHGGGMMNDGSWGRDAQAREDFAYRGVHLTALATKALARRFYGRPARYSYFVGCSDGGREGLMEAQRFPQDFDGIAAGAPAMNFLVQNSFYHAWQARSNSGPDGQAILTAAKLPALHRAALAACDAVDGLADGQITDPRVCRFDPAMAGCKPGQPSRDDCLTPAEIEAARRLYDGPRDAAGHRFTLGGPQVGSELAWTGVFVPAAPGGMTISPKAALPVIRYLAFPENPPASITLADFRFDRATFAKLAALHPLYDATDTNLAPFAARKGKLILFHGWSDPHISPINTIAYYDGVQTLLGAERTRAFARLFLFPGLYHCGGGDGPADFDVVTPLMAWVEGGNAPGSILASRAPAVEEHQGPPPGAGGTPDPFAAALGDRPASGGPARATDRTRPVFAYPQVARYAGTGSVNAAASFGPAPSAVAPGSTPDWEGRAFIGPDIRR